MTARGSAKRTSLLGVIGVLEIGVSTLLLQFVTAGVLNCCSTEGKGVDELAGGKIPFEGVRRADFSGVFLISIFCSGDRFERVLFEGGSESFASFETA